MDIYKEVLTEYAPVEELAEYMKNTKELDELKAITCKNCKHLCEIYFPPTLMRQMHKYDGCFAVAEENEKTIGKKRIYQLPSHEEGCRRFEPKEEE